MNIRPLPPAPRWLTLLGTIAASTSILLMLFPRWEAQAHTGEFFYSRPSLFFFPGLFAAALALAAVGAGISLIRDPYDPAQRLAGGLIASAAGLGSTFLLVRIPVEAVGSTWRATGYVHVARGALFVACFAFAAPLTAFLNRMVLSEEERAGDAHPGLEPSDD